MGQQGQQSSGDNSLGPVWIMGFIVLIGYCAWYFGHVFIVSFVFALNVAQINLIDFFIHSPSLENDAFLMRTLDPSSVEWSQLVAFTHNVGIYSRYPLIVIILGLAVILYRSDVTLKFRRRHSMSTLREQEQNNWPSIMPVIKEDLTAADVNSGPWAMALTPMEFARKYQLLKKSDALLDSNNTPGTEMTAGLRRGDAKRIFTIQLGPSWNGFEHCPVHVKALAAVFMARINRDKVTAASILKKLDQSFVRGKLDPGEVDSMIQKYIKTELVAEIISRHAYLLTVLASLLEAARQDGVVPTSEFLWLKVVDRRLWYMFNCVGRQTPFAEVGGPFAHWKAEKVMGRSARAPMIDEAIKALEIALKEVKLSPKELQELKP